MSNTKYQELTEKVTKKTIIVHYRYNTIT